MTAAYVLTPDGRRACRVTGVTRYHGPWVHVATSEGRWWAARREMTVIPETTKEARNG